MATLTKQSIMHEGIIIETKRPLWLRKKNHVTNILNYRSTALHTTVQSGKQAKTIWPQDLISTEKLIFIAEPFYWTDSRKQTGVERESQLVVLSQSNYRTVSDSQSKQVNFNEHPGGEFPKKI